MTRQMADDEVLRVLRQAAMDIDEERCPISAAITHVIAVQSRAERAESALEALRGQVAGIAEMFAETASHSRHKQAAEVWAYIGKTLSELLAIKERMG